MRTCSSPLWVVAVSLVSSLGLPGCANDEVGDGNDAADGASGSDSGSADAGDGDSGDADAGSDDGDAAADAGTDAGDGDGDGDGDGTGPFCGDGTKDPDELCDDGNDSPYDGCLPDCTVVAPLNPPDLQWTYYEIPGTKCMNGETAGFGVSRSPTSTKLMIYFEGGGACFDDACDFTAFSVPFIPPIDGIFSRINPLNPIGDWSMVYVPYCTGDLHGGGTETVLGGQTRYFWGYKNVEEYLKVWGATFPEVDTVLVTGISAGGYGAGINGIRIGKAFGPSRQLVVIDDSGPPFSNAVIPPCLQTKYREVWGLDDTILAECGAMCPDPEDWASGLLAYVTSADPNARIGFYSNTADTVIRLFLGAGWGNGTYDNCGGTPNPVPQDTFEDDLLAIREGYEDQASTYYVGTTRLLEGAGLWHTVLRSPTFYTTDIDGDRVYEWVEAVVNGDVTHVGP